MIQPVHPSPSHSIVFVMDTFPLLFCCFGARFNRKNIRIRRSFIFFCFFFLFISTESPISSSSQSLSSTMEHPTKAFRRSNLSTHFRYFNKNVVESGVVCCKDRHWSPLIKLESCGLIVMKWREEKRIIFFLRSRRETHSNSSGLAHNGNAVSFCMWFLLGMKCIFVQSFREFVRIIGVDLAGVSNALGNIRLRNRVESFFASFFVVFFFLQRDWRGCIVKECVTKR